MTGRTETWLARLSDPAGINERWRAAPFELSEGSAIAEMVETASRHNVRPVLVRNLGLQARSDPAALMRGPAETVRARLADVMVAANEARLADVGRAVLLARAAEDIFAPVHAQGLPAILVKGADFAVEAYGGLQARTFSDVDILVRPGAEVELGRVLADLGYAEHRPKASREAHTERKWTRPDAHGGTILVEVHTDLVHAPELRARQTLTYDLHAGPAAGGVTPAARLVLAALHGATSHLFGRLQYVVDGLMVARMGVDRAELRERAIRSGALLPTLTMLRLATEIFPFEEGHDLIDALSPVRFSGLEHRLITTSGVLGGKAANRWMLLPQRYLYRRLLQMTPAPA